MLSELGPTSGQAEMLRSFADRKIVEVAGYEDGVMRLEQPFFDRAECVRINSRFASARDPRTMILFWCVNTQNKTRAPSGVTDRIGTTSAAGARIGFAWLGLAATL